MTFAAIRQAGGGCVPRLFYEERDGMDLNELFFHHQLSLLRAMEAGCPERRARHEDAARGYAERIAAWRAERRADEEFDHHPWA